LVRFEGFFPGTVIVPETIIGISRLRSFFCALLGGVLAVEKFRPDQTRPLLAVNSKKVASGSTSGDILFVGPFEPATKQVCLDSGGKSSATSDWFGLII
jgi:hypothetical protein